MAATKVQLGLFSQERVPLQPLFGMAKDPGRKLKKRIQNNWMEQILCLIEGHKFPSRLSLNVIALLLGAANVSLGSGTFATL